MDEGSRDESAIWANYSPTRSYKNKLIRLEQDGNEYTVIEDAGADTICVTNDKIFYESTIGNTNKVYSIDLEGNNKEEYVEGNMKYLVGDYIYVQGSIGAQGMNKIDAINIKNGKMTTIVDDGTLVGVADDNIYYVVSNYKDIGTLKIGYIKGSENQGTVATVSKSEYDDSDYSLDYSNVSFIEFKYVDNKVKIAVGDIQGTGYFVQQGFIVEMDADGNNVTKTPITVDDETPEMVLNLKAFAVKMGDGGLMYTNPKTNETTEIITYKELSKKLGIEVDDGEYTMSIYSADVMGTELYIILDSGVHNPAEDMGWRYSYKREKTVAFKYDLEKEEIEVIYEY